MPCAQHGVATGQAWLYSFGTLQCTHSGKPQVACDASFKAMLHKGGIPASRKRQCTSLIPCSCSPSEARSSRETSTLQSTTKQQPREGKCLNAVAARIEEIGTTNWSWETDVTAGIRMSGFSTWKHDPKIKLRQNKLNKQRLPFSRM